MYCIVCRRVVLISRGGKLSGLSKNQLHILMQSQTRKNCLHWYKSMDLYTELYTKKLSTLVQLVQIHGFVPV